MADADDTNINDDTETAHAPQSRRLQLKVGGMGCSFCSRTIEKAYRQTDGVLVAHVSLAHEEALIEYDPERADAATLRSILAKLGYSARDLDRVKAREEQQEELRLERRRLIVAGVAAGVTAVLMIGMLFDLTEAWWCIPILMVLAAGTVFGAGRHILTMAWQSVRRGILNQHVLLEIGALGAFTGGVLGAVGELALTAAAAGASAGETPAAVALIRSLGQADSLAALTAFPAGQFFSVATFLAAYHLLSGYVAKLVQARASDAVAKLLDLQPETALVVVTTAGGAEVEREVPVDEVRAGDRVRVHPGERVPVDGRVIEGSSAVDESLVSGESLPVDKSAGSDVTGGSINQSGSLLVECTRVGEASFLRTVARAIDEARAMKPGILELVDVVLARYVPLVLLVGIATFVGWTAGAWLLTGEALFVRAVFATLAVFVMGYPCAIGMATPLALIRGGGEAARRGVLMRSGHAFATLRSVDRIVFDKTGTLTAGRPAVTDVVALAAPPAKAGSGTVDKAGVVALAAPRDGAASGTVDETGDVSLAASPGDAASGAGESAVLALAAAVERHSEHPLARAIVARAEEAGVAIPSIRDFESTSGGGVRGYLDAISANAGDGSGAPGATAGGPPSGSFARTAGELGDRSSRAADQPGLVTAGSLRFLREAGVSTGSATTASALEAEGKTIVGVAVDGVLVGLIALADTVKPDARRTIDALAERGLPAVMLSGDNRRAAEAVAGEVGIDAVTAEVRPEEKVERIRSLQAAGHRVAMAGDGINDAAALMQADAGIAVGAGTDIAIDSADIVLTGDRLSGVVDAFDIGRSSYRKTVQNVVLAFAFNGLGVPLAAAGILAPAWAMVAMVASVSAVLANSFGGRLRP